MSYLIDSDWVADYLKGRPPSVGQLERLAPAGMAISAITFGEVYEGIYYGADRAQNERVWRDFLEGVAVLDVDRSVAERFAVIRGTLRLRGQLIESPDILIAATALEYDLTLVTRNVAHFARIPELRLLAQA